MLPSPIRSSMSTRFGWVVRLPKVLQMLVEAVGEKAVTSIVLASVQHAGDRGAPEINGRGRRVRNRSRPARSA
jgi:hypothetical protein